MTKKLPEKDFNIVKTKMTNLSTTNVTLSAFAEVFQPLVLFMKNEIEIDPNKQIYDLVILTDDNEIVVKGKIPENYKLYELAVAIIYTLTMYINQQFTRGKNKNPVLWIKSAHILNKDIYESLPYFLEDYINEENKIIDKFKSDNNFNYKYDEGINYEILKQYMQEIMQKNTTQNSNKNNQQNASCSCDSNGDSSDIQQKIQDAIDSLMNECSSCSLDNDMAQTIFNLSKVAEKIENMSLSEQNIQELENSYDKIKDNISNESRNKMEDVIDNLKNSMQDYNYFNENTNQVEWAKHIQDEEKSKQVENATQMVRDIVRKNFDKVRGKLSAHVAEILEDILELRLPWQEILKHIITTYFDKSTPRRWNYPNVFYRRIGYFPSEDYEEKINNITLFIDTSGSMSSDELRQIFGIVKDIMENIEINTLTIVQHSYDLTHVDTYELDELSEDILRSIKVYGRGGTSHIRPFKEYYKLIDEQEVPYPDLILFCSDFVSDFDELYHNDMFEEFKDKYFAVSTHDTNLPEQNKVIKITRRGIR